MFTPLDEEPNKFYSINRRGIQIYTILERTVPLPYRKHMHMFIFVVGKSGGITGYQYSWDSKTSVYHDTVITEYNHNPYDMYDIAAYIGRELEGKLIKESLNPDVLPDKELDRLLTEGVDNLIKYGRNIYVYPEGNKFIHTMKERK